MSKRLNLIMYFLLIAILYGISPLVAESNAAQLRVVYGFDREFPPFSYQAPGGEPVGFEVEILQTIFRDDKIEMRPLDWYNVEVELAAGTINISSGMVRTPKRELMFDFSKLPVFTLKQQFFTKTYKRVPNASFLRGQPVAVEEFSYSKFLLEKFGGVIVRLYKTRPQALRALYNEEVDAFLGADQTTYYLLRKLNYENITTIGAPLALTDIYYAVNKSRGDILRKLNQGMDELISSGEYDRIYRKWFVTELELDKVQEIVTKANESTINGYAPYGGINYGAAILTATGKIITGANVENADTTVSLSAIQSALARCIMENEMELLAVAVVDQNGDLQPLTRDEMQSLIEFGKGILVINRDETQSLSTTMLGEMLKSPVTNHPVDYSNNAVK